MIKKTLLITVGVSVFSWADLNHNEKRVFQDVKIPYTIQDEKTEISTSADRQLLPNENVQIPTGVDHELLPMEEIFDMPDEDPKKQIKKEYKKEQKKIQIPKSVEKKKHTKKTPKVKQTQQKSKKELEIERIRKELDIKGPTKRELKLQKIKEELDIKEPSARTLRIDAIREELKIGYRKPKYESTLDKRIEDVKEGIDGISVDNAISSIKNTLGMKREKKDTGFFITDSLSAFGDTIGMDLEMPSFFGFGGKKKKSSGILDSVMGFGFLGDIKDTGTSIYKGAKYSGQSAELMSGMMYNSSKMYNNMFGIFDDSAFNIFEEEEEASMFDIFEHGNSVMDMFNN